MPTGPHPTDPFPTFIGLPDGYFDLPEDEREKVIGQMADIMLEEQFGIKPSGDDRGRVTFLDPKNMTDVEIEDTLAFINEGMPESSESRIWSGGRDSNSRSPGPKPGALPS